MGYMRSFFCYKDEDEVENGAGPFRNDYVNHPSMCPMDRDHGFARIAAAAPIIRQFAPWPRCPDMVTIILPC